MGRSRQTDDSPDVPHRGWNAACLAKLHKPDKTDKTDKLHKYGNSVKPLKSDILLKSGTSHKRWKTDMSNILGKEVIQLKSDITVETIEADEDYRIGRIAAKVANRVKIAWNGTNDYIYVNLDELNKLDNSTYIYPVPLNLDMMGNTALLD
jgi:hypothetical protein